MRNDKKIFPILVIAVLLLTACDYGGPVDKFLGIKQTTPEPSLPATIEQAAMPAEPTCTPECPQTVCGAPIQEIVDSSCPGGPLSPGTEFGPILNNMDVGDNQMAAVVYAWDGHNPLSAFIAIIDQSFNLDFERDTIYGTYWHFINRSAAECQARDLWFAKGGTSYRLYVGNDDAPPGWSKEFPSGWTMKTWVFTDTTIEVPGAVWDKQTVQVGDKSHTYGSSDWTYGQPWDGIDASEVDHFIVAPDYSVESPKYQGTVWTVSNVTVTTVSTLVMRFMQMTSEVILRDDHPVVHQYYCGPEYLMPSGWTSTMPDGWSCSNN